MATSVLKVLKLHTDKHGELRYRQLVERRSIPSAVYGQVRNIPGVKGHLGLKVNISLIPNNLA